MEHLLLVGRWQTLFAAPVDYQDGLLDGVLSTAYPTSGDRSSCRYAFQANLYSRPDLH